MKKKLFVLVVGLFSIFSFANATDVWVGENSDGIISYAMTETTVGRFTSDNRITIKEVYNGEVNNYRVYHFTYEEGTWYYYLVSGNGLVPVSSNIIAQNALQVYLKNSLPKR